MKRIIAVLMALMMVLSLSACKDKDTVSSSASTTSGSEASQNATDTETGNTDAVHSGSDTSAVSSEVLPSDTETTPHAAVTSGTVVDAIAYSKKVTVAKGANAKDYENQMHVVAVPEISKDTKNAKAFNDKIYNEVASIYESLTANKEGKQVYNIGYEYKEYKNTVAVMVLNNTTTQGGNSTFVYKVYYYDLKKDKELTYKDYLKKVGLSKKKIKKIAEGTKEFSEMLSMSADKEKVYVKDCLVDSQSAILFINNPNEKDGWWRIDVGSVF